MSDTAGSRPDAAGSPNGGAVDRLLLEAGLEDDGGLRPVLLDLQSLAAGQPAPSKAVAALMVPAGYRPSAAAAPAGPPADELAARRRAKRRITLTTLSVAVSLAAGGAVAVASDRGIRDTFGQLNHAVTSFVAGAGGAASDKAGQAPLTDPAQPGDAASVPGPGAPALSDPGAPPPTAPSATAPPAAQPESGAAHGREGVPAPSAPTAVPPSGIALPENPAAGSEPGAGVPLNTGPLDGETPSVPGEQPSLPLPVKPTLSPAPGQ